jgi:flavin-dependent dehydrogenase
MLLARKGYNVLLVDRDTFPSDIMSTHYIHLAGKVRLHRWGLLQSVTDSGCPPIPKANLHMNGTVFNPPAPPMPEGVTTEALCPRRYILDKILIDAAVEAGVEFREGVSVRDLVWEGDTVAGICGHSKDGDIEERGRIVIGADGLHSVVARHVKPKEYDAKPTYTFAYYTYWPGLSDPEMHIYFFEDSRGILTFPTHDGLTCIGVGGALEGFQEFRSDIEANYLAVLDRVPGLGEQVRATKPAERFIGTADQPNYFRVPYGAGWALVGDAGYHRDFLTGLGITDAFRDAEYVAQAIDEGFSGQRPLDEAMADYQQKRDTMARPLYNLTVKMASGIEPAPTDWMAFGAAMAQMINS